MGGLGDHAGNMIYILLGVLLVVAVMLIVTSLSKTAKGSTNANTVELGTQVARFENSMFEELDMATCSGSQLKQYIENSYNEDCAFLVQTLALAGNQPEWKGSNLGMDDNFKFIGVASKLNGSTVIHGVSGKANTGQTFDHGTGFKETTFNGVAFTDSVDGRLPVVMVDFADGNSLGNHKSGVDHQVSVDSAIAGDMLSYDYSSGRWSYNGTEDGSVNAADTGTFIISTALKTNLYNPCLVNYGTILKNAVCESGTTGDEYTSIFQSYDNGHRGVQALSTISAYTWDSAGVENAQTIAYLDGRFHTKQEFAVSQAGIFLRYDNISDTQQAGKTMYIDDNATFKTYCLVDSTGAYKGVVFFEKNQ